MAFKLTLHNNLDIYYTAAKTIVNNYKIKEYKNTHNRRLMPLIYVKTKA